MRYGAIKDKERNGFIIIFAVSCGKSRFDEEGFAPVR